MTQNAPQSRHTQRDREALMALGLFLIVLAVPVLLGTFFEEKPVHRAVNIVSGLALLALGAIWVIRGRRPVQKP